MKLKGKHPKEDQEQGQYNGLGKVSHKRGIDEKKEGLTHGMCN